MDLGRDNATLYQTGFQVFLDELLGVETNSVKIWVVSNFPFAQASGIVRFGFFNPFLGFTPHRPLCRG